MTEITFKITELFLITQEEFENKKTNEKISLKCSICNVEYLKLKKYILQHDKRQNVSNSFCSPKCKGISFTTKKEVTCSYCFKQFVKQRCNITSNNFCTSSCSVSFNNSKRTISETTKQKLKSSKQKQKELLITSYNKSPVKCKVCDTPLVYEKRQNKVCSKACSNILVSMTMKLKIEQGYNPQKHRGRKKSYLEESFKRWLEMRSISFIEEYPVKIYNSGKYQKCYFIDFYFPELSLGLELDGTQHLKTIQEDIVRDSLIKSNSGIEIYRISHKDYVKKTKIDFIKNLLNIDTK